MGRLLFPASGALECMPPLSCPCLGTKARITPFLMTGMAAEGLDMEVDLCLLGSGLSSQSGPSNFLLPLLYWLRDLSTVFLAQGWGPSWAQAHLQRLLELCEAVVCMVMRPWAPAVLWALHSLCLMQLGLPQERCLRLWAWRGLLLWWCLQASWKVALWMGAFSRPGGVKDRDWIRARLFLCALPDSAAWRWWTALDRVDGHSWAAADCDVSGVARYEFRYLLR